MNFEELQKAWQAQDPAAKVTITTDVLLNEVRRNQQQFWATIFWRDVKEVGVAYMLAIFFMGFAGRHDLANFLVGLACFGVGTFMVGDRLWQRRTQAATGDPLKACIENSLVQVRHQIWLLKNVFWWYLLPIGAPLAVSTFVSLWHSRHAAAAVIGWCLYGLFGVLLYWGIYWLNQFAVRKSLEPRRQELETLLANLK